MIYFSIEQIAIKRIYRVQTSLWCPNNLVSGTLNFVNVNGNMLISIDYRKLILIFSLSFHLHFWLTLLLQKHYICHMYISHIIQLYDLLLHIKLINIIKNPSKSLKLSLFFKTIDCDRRLSPEVTEFLAPPCFAHALAIKHACVGFHQWWKNFGSALAKWKLKCITLYICGMTRTFMTSYNYETFRANFDLVRLKLMLRSWHELCCVNEKLLFLLFQHKTYANQGILMWENCRSIKNINTH